MLENVSVVGAQLSASSEGLKITIPSSHSTLQPPLPSLPVLQLLQPSHVQPSCANKAQKMNKVLASIVEDDDGTMRMPGQRKQQVEDDPKQFSTVPEGIEHNPIAPMKRCKKDPIESLHAVPLLPLQPAYPEQLPP